MSGIEKLYSLCVKNTEEQIWRLKEVQIIDKRVKLAIDKIRSDNIPDECIQGRIVEYVRLLVQSYQETRDLIIGKPKEGVDAMGKPPPPRETGPAAGWYME